MSTARKCRRLRKPDATAIHEPRAADAGAVHDPDSRTFHDAETGEVLADVGAWERATEEQRDQARARLAAVRQAEDLIAIGIPRADADATAGTEARVSAAVVGRWRGKVKRLPEGARVYALLDGKRSGRPAKIAGDVREILEALDNHNPAHLTAKHCHRTLIARLGHAPAKSTISHWLAARRRDFAYERSAVSNPDRHRSHRKPAGGDAAAGIERLNQLWELDSTPADVICDDGKRHAIVAAIDIWSRRTRVLVVPSSRAIAIAALLRRCLLDWGVPEIVRTDEGADYTSRHVLGVLADLEIEHDACPPYTPEAKPFVERFLGTMSRDLFANLDGFTGHNVSQAEALRARKSYAQRHRAGRARNQDRARCEDDVAAYGCSLTAEELQARCDAWCDAIYGREAHDGLGGMTPFDRATSWAGTRKTIQDKRALDALLAEPAGEGWRTVVKKGIRLGNVFYIAGPLGSLVKQRVRVRHDPADASRLFVYQADGTFVCVAEDPARTGADRAAIAGQMKAKWNDANRTARATARDLQRRHRPERAMDEVLAKAIEESERVVALPRKGETHETPALAQAARAAEAADAADAVARNAREGNRDEAPAPPPKAKLMAGVRWLTQEGN